MTERQEPRFEPSVDERRIITWLRARAIESPDDAMAYEAAAQDIEQGEHSAV